MMKLNEPGGIYADGQEVIVTIRAGKAGNLAALERIVVLAENERPLAVSVTKTETEWQCRFTPPRPGWYVCEAHFPHQPENEKPPAVGLIVAPEILGPARPEPADFEAFWESKRAEVAAEPSDPSLTPLTDEQKKRELLPDSLPVAGQEERAWRLEADGIERWNLEIAMPAGVHPVRGYLARPSHAENRSCPVILLLHAAGIGQHWCRGNSTAAMALAEKHHALVLDLNAHGLRNGESEGYYETWREKLKVCYQNADDWNSTHLAGMALRLLRAIDYLASLPEWDGRHLVCIGESQGGGQALNAAGLDRRVSGVIALVPAMCDFAGPDAGRPAGNPHPSMNPENTETVLARLLYSDNVYLSKRSRARTLIFAGLIDPTCPAPGIAAAYNSLPGEKEILYFPHKRHTDFPEEDLWIGKYDALKDAFLDEHFAKEPAETGKGTVLSSSPPR